METQKVDISMAEEQVLFGPMPEAAAEKSAPIYHGPDDDKYIDRMMRAHFCGQH